MTGRQGVGGDVRARKRPLWASVAVLLALLSGAGSALPSSDVPVGLTATGTGAIASTATTATSSDYATVTSSAMSLSGKGDFADLHITVGQTADLVDQSVSVTWKWADANPSGHATIVEGSNIEANYLQIMQCWGDSAPDRTQCVFGAFHSDSAATGVYSNSRDILSTKSGQAAGYPGAVDPLESAIDPADTATWGNWVKSAGAQFRVPFASVSGQTTTWDQLTPGNNPLFSSYDSNEIPYAKTRGDGTGDEIFETTTYQESAGLGCADLLKSGSRKGKPRNCWLVVVPRGLNDVDGKRYDAHANITLGLESSPLSLTNWNNRIAFPLAFQPVGAPCPIAAAQRPTGGVETSTQAVLRWQPLLCSNGGTVFSYLKLADSVTESGLTGPGSDVAGAGLAFLNAPVSPSDVPGDRTLVYAPIAVSGIGLGMLIERSPVTGAPTAEQQRSGERLSDVKLTPRLVAKILTNSYQSSISTAAHYLDANPVGLGRDPEFLALNPDFKDLNNISIEVLVPTGVAYTTSMLWRYVDTDPEARDFVAGRPDDWGMRVNPFYQGLTIPTESFPKIDPFCRKPTIAGLPQLCQLDLHPYMQDFFEDARYTSKGDSRALRYKTGNGNNIDPTTATERVPPADPGLRTQMGVSDTATAARFLLPMVKLRNASGQFVAPTTASMLAAVPSMASSGVAGVRLASPQAATGAAYPLTTITYAVTAPNQLNSAAAKDYANFIRYAVGPGQVPGVAPGSLPYGYAPLPASLRTQAKQAAQQVQNRIGPKQTATSSGSGSGGGGSGGGVKSPATTPSPAPAPSASTPARSTTLAGPQLRSDKTPADSPVSTAMRYALIGALLVGTAGVLLGPLLPRVALRFGRQKGTRR